MKPSEFIMARPLIEKMENLIVNRDELQTAVDALEGSTIPIKISYGGNARKATTTIGGTDISTERLVRSIINNLQIEIDDLIAQVEAI